MNRTSVVVVGVFAFLCCSALYAADWEETEALSETIKTNDLCEATVHPPGKVVSGGQVLGCDWSWTMKTPLSYASWKSYYPEEPARQHGVRFEGEYIPEGEGGDGTPRIYDWGLTVTDANKICDWRRTNILPIDHQPFLPDFLGTELIPKSCPVRGGRTFSSLFETVCLGHDAQGNALFGCFHYDPLSFNPMGVLPAPTNKLRGGACPHCQGDVCQYEILVEERSIRPTWRTWIERVEWTEKNESKRSDTLKAWAYLMGLIDKHENQHKADYQTYFVDMVNLRYDRYYCKYRVAYCVNGNPDHANMAVKDLKAMIDVRKKAFEDSYDTKAYGAFNASADRLDAHDYPNIKSLLEAFGWNDELENQGEIWGFPL